MLANITTLSPLELTDQQLLRKHMDEYHWLADHFRWDEFKQLWTEDAVFEVASGGRTYVGRDEIVRIQSGRIHERYERTQHLIVNCAFEVDGDSATGHANLLFIGVPKASEPAQNYMSGGMYEWRFRKTPDGWRSAHTRLEFLWESAGQVGLEFFATQPG